MSGAKLWWQTVGLSVTASNPASVIVPVPVSNPVTLPVSLFEPVPLSEPVPLLLLLLLLLLFAKQSVMLICSSIGSPAKCDL